MTKDWPKVKLGEVLSRSQETVELRPDAEYRQITVKLWGKGVVQRGILTGAEIAAPRQMLARRGQFILSRIDARNGASGIVPDELDGAIVSNDFPVFNVMDERLLPSYFGWMCKTATFIKGCQHASEGTTNRVRLQENKFLAREISLPPFAEQRRIVARIEELAAKIEEARGIRADVSEQLDALLFAAYRRIAETAPRKQISEVAPLTRRPVKVDIRESYAQVAVRSFGRGTFHKPPLNGNEVTWQKPFLVKTGDILVSNIKAWEGAIAVALKQDDGHVGSHRYLTFVPIPNVATANFIRFYLLTPEGLYDVGEASPGSADRNRTLNSKRFLQILVPMPEYGQQLWFDRLHRQVSKIRQFHAETVCEIDALMRSVLDKAFRGEL